MTVPDNAKPVSNTDRGTGRRPFLAWSSAAALAVGAGWEALARVFAAEDQLDGWDAGAVAHLLPAVDHRHIRLNVSLHQPLAAAPVLMVGDRRAEGAPACAGGKHWMFDQAGLASGVSYRLQLSTRSGAPLCPSWRLKTFPAPDDQPERFRLLTYTCAGGPDFFIDFKLNPAFLPISLRRKLLRRALDLQPDAIVANGDHIYWDRDSRKGWGMGESPMARWKAGLFNPQAPAESAANLRVIQRGLGVQIAGLYRTMMRSCPVFFMQDDHDFLNNDEVIDGQPLFPPGRFHRDVARLTQAMYYPELTAGSHGVLRYGGLFEGLLYSCRSQMNAGAEGYFVPADIERWIVRRLKESPSRYVAQFPSCPFLWTAGKWGEWYPDVLRADGQLSTTTAKPHWRPAWNQQHNRLLSAASQNRERLALTISGDLHASALGKITRSGDLDFAANPPVSLLPGTAGTGAPGWPSSFRGVPAAPSLSVEAHAWLPPQERNGFSILDFTPDNVTISLYGWQPADGEAAIATLKPFHVQTLNRTPGA